MKRWECRAITEDTVYNVILDAPSMQSVLKQFSAWLGDGVSEIVTEVTIEPFKEEIKVRK